MTAQIARAIESELDPRGVAVLVEAEHMCMSMRGVLKQGSSTVTVQFSGSFRDNPSRAGAISTLVRCASGRSSLFPEEISLDDTHRQTSHALSRDKSEEGADFQPRFDANGLIVCVTIEAATREILMVAYMNQLALDKTIETGDAHYWSRSRQSLWRKGDTSGQVQKVVSLQVDCDQDAILLEVEPGGDGKACHTGRKSCFYRKLERGSGRRLVFVQ